MRPSAPRAATGHNRPCSPPPLHEPSPAAPSLTPDAGAVVAGGRHGRRHGGGAGRTGPGRRRVRRVTRWPLDAHHPARHLVAARASWPGSRLLPAELPGRRTARGPVGAARGQAEHTPRHPCQRASGQRRAAGRGRGAASAHAGAGHPAAGLAACRREPHRDRGRQRRARRALAHRGGPGCGGRAGVPQRLPPERHAAADAQRGQRRRLPADAVPVVAPPLGGRAGQLRRAGAADFGAQFQLLPRRHRLAGRDRRLLLLRGAGRQRGAAGLLRDGAVGPAAARLPAGVGGRRGDDDADRRGGGGAGPDPPGPRPDLPAAAAADAALAVAGGPPRPRAAHRRPAGAAVLAWSWCSAPACTTTSTSRATPR